MPTTAQVTAFERNVLAAANEFAEYATNREVLFNFIKNVPVVGTSYSTAVKPIAAANTATSQGPRISGSFTSGTRVTLVPTECNNGLEPVYYIDFRTCNPKEVAKRIVTGSYRKANMDVQGMFAGLEDGGGTSGAAITLDGLEAAKFVVEANGGDDQQLVAVMQSSDYNKLLTATRASGSIAAANQIVQTGEFPEIFGMKIVRVNNCWATTASGNHDIAVLHPEALIVGIAVDEEEGITGGVDIRVLDAPDYNCVYVTSSWQYAIAEYKGLLGVKISVK